jgi:6,7-dimethyl-8-ribityllumazine synthase
MSKDSPAFTLADIPTTARIAIVAARFNARFVDELLIGCRRRLGEEEIAGYRLDIHRVPGAFELPVTAKRLAETGRYSAVICLGCVIRGDTPHFDFVAGEAARGVQQVAITTGVPIIFGVLTTNTEQQVMDRIGGPHGHAGERAAEAAMEMTALFAKIKPA